MPRNVNIVQLDPQQIFAAIRHLLPADARCHGPARLALSGTLDLIVSSEAFTALPNDGVDRPRELPRLAVPVEAAE